MIRYIALITALSPLASFAFAPQAIVTKRTMTIAKSASKEVDDFEVGQAQFCADHFGECSLEEMERMRDLLHQERVSNIFTGNDGLRNLHGLEEDLQHKVLEQDLTLQMGLLQDKLATEHMQEDSQWASGVNPRSGTIHLPVMDGGLDEESSEALMICLAIAALATLPQLLA